MQIFCQDKVTLSIDDIRSATLDEASNCGCRTLPEAHTTCGKLAFHGPAARASVFGPEMQALTHMRLNQPVMPTAPTVHRQVSHELDRLQARLPKVKPFPFYAFNTAVHGQASQIVRTPQPHTGSCRPLGTHSQNGRLPHTYQQVRS